MALHTALDMPSVPKGLGQRRTTWQGTRDSASCLLGCARHPDHVCLLRVWAVPQAVPHTVLAAVALTWPGGTGQAPVRTPEEPHAATAVLQLRQPWQGVGALWKEKWSIRLLQDRERTCGHPLQPAGAAVAGTAREITVWGQRLAQSSWHSSPSGHCGTQDAV